MLGTSAPPWRSAGRNLEAPVFFRTVMITATDELFDANLVRALGSADAPAGGTPAPPRTEP
jgi:hypothetical protein